MEFFEFEGTLYPEHWFKCRKHPVGKVGPGSRLVGSMRLFQRGGNEAMSNVSHFR
jgi:hypothetical protein